MLRFRGLFCLAGLLLLCSCVPLPRAKKRQDSAARLKKEGKILLVEDVARMLKEARAKGETLKGHGLSVFEGTEPEKFGIEIVDVLRNYIFPGHDLILFRATHPKWIQGNVISGMSGSPCYLDGKLIGALSYTMGFFQKDGLAGMTPIEYMLRDMDRPEEEHGFLPPRGEKGLVPVRTPLVAAGFGTRAMRLLEKAFEDRHHEVARGGAGSAVAEAQDTLVPGGAVSIRLMGGDLDLSAIGTVTFVEGKRVLAFGHSLFGTGPFEVPMTSAVVHTTMRGLGSSFKIGSSGREVGALISDRSNAVYGELGREARMVPVKITVSNPGTGAKHEANFRVIDDREWMPDLVSLARESCVDAFEPSQKTRVTETRAEVTLENGRKIRFREMVQHEASGGGMFLFFGGGGGGVLGRVNEIIGNQYEDPRIASIRIDVSNVHEDRTVYIEDAILLTPEVEDGGTVRVRLRLRKFRGKKFFKEVRMRLPDGLEAGTEVALEVAGGGFADPDRPPASNLDELLRTLEKEFPAASIVVSAGLPSFHLAHRGQVLDRFPASVLASMGPSFEESALLGNVTVRRTIDTEWIVSGYASFTVKIRERGTR
ncbi:MAG: hypothetical protein ACYTAF_06925 [Planctomycetota bacterium]|jgi:hypothetical protein